MRVLEKQATWKREDGFDRIEVIAEMLEHTVRRLHPALIRNLFILNCTTLDLSLFFLFFFYFSVPLSPTPEDFTLDMNVKVESLRLEILLSQPPQRRRSHAVGTGLDEPGVPHPEMQQTEQGGTFSFQAGFDGFLHVDCSRIPEQERTSSCQADVGVNPETTTTVQVAARQEFVKLPMVWEQRGMIAWSTEQTKQFDPAGEWIIHYSFLPEDGWFRVPVLAMHFCLFVCNCFRVYNARTRGEENFPPGMEEIGIREPDE